MIAPCLILLGSVAAAANEQVIDAFAYADDEAAGGAWVAGSNTPPAEVVAEDDRRVLRFHAPFAADPELERTILDRNVTLNLAAAGEFALEIAADQPKACNHLSLYFRSGGGWYSGSAGLVKEGWQTIRFSKASYRTEGEPAGWHQIDGIRISVWRGQAVDAVFRLRRLVARWNDVAVVIPAQDASSGELSSARKTAEDVTGMLSELGLGSDAVDDQALLNGALGDRRVAVLAYHPRLGPEAADVLARFVDAGGKLFACYSLPAKLAEAIGLGPMKHVPQERSGHFAEIRFEGDDVAGLPDSAQQKSWNLNVPTSTGEGTRVIGRWFNDEGKPTGEPALLLSDQGAFMTHIILTDDRDAKKQMLAAVLGELHPPLWRQMAENAIERAGRVGHLENAEEVKEFVSSYVSGQKVTTDDEARRLLDARNIRVRGDVSLDQAKNFLERGNDAVVAVSAARDAHELLVDAYVRSHPSPTTEGRAFWNHSGTGAYPGDWQRTAKELSEAGFNMVVPNLLWAGRAHYPSDVLPRSSTFDEHGDQIAQCLAACKEHGIEVHVWKVNHNLSGAPKEFVEKLRREGRLQASRSGEEERWLCPSHPDNSRLELESMLEVARKYDVDGLHFDYIRYPNRDHCYCDGCRERFTTASGVEVAAWPADCYSGPFEDRYHDWRCEQITRLVAAVAQEARKIKPKIKISAAVFGAYPDCRRSVGQDWVGWIKAGYLDFVCPMDYTQSDMQFTGLVENQLRLVEGRIPVYPGIGAWRLTPDRVVGQIHHARSLGADGFTVFNLTDEAAEHLLPKIALGAGSQAAAPPHQNK
ncbi:MAG: glycoside hydrolase family 10 protein [Planctomycetota bacterium]|jgi:uncharacterized lipoprotein YddW (UPF0748 family)